MELDHQKMTDIMGRRRKFLNYNEDDLKLPPSDISTTTATDAVDDCADDVSNNDKLCGIREKRHKLKLLLQSIVHLYEKLDIFWMRYNRTRIDCVCLKEEKLSLQRNNKELKNKLKNYLVTVNMTTGHPVHSNDNFTNRPSSMKVERVEHFAITSKNELIKKSKQDRRPVTTCIEGNLSNAVRHLKITNTLQSIECYAIANKL
jgi:hypothetical protein